MLCPNILMKKVYNDLKVFKEGGGGGDAVLRVWLFLGGWW